MEQAHWLEREQASMAHALAATLPDVKRIHYELARGYRIKAANAGRQKSASVEPRLKMNLREQLASAFRP
jgi:hypothetical protein